MHDENSLFVAHNEADPPGSIQLDSGRQVTLSALNQWRTYAGWLEGLPSPEHNKDIIAGVIDKERNRGHEPFFVVPVEVERERGTFLPSVVCVADFESSATAHDPDGIGSCLTIVWFQDAFALPIEQDVVEKIRRVNWDTNAWDWVP